MQISSHALEKFISLHYKKIDKKIQESFENIRNDLSEIDSRVQKLRKVVKNFESQNKYSKKEEEKIRNEFRKDVDEFTQKTAQLSLTLSEVRALRNEVVVMRDLAKIEERIKQSFKEEIEIYKEKVKELKNKQSESEKRIKALEKGKTLHKRKYWFN